MSEQELKNLINELKKIETEIEQSSFVDPQKIRRIDEIRSLLLSSGENKNITFTMVKQRKSERVTSFTKDRR